MKKKYLTLILGLLCSALFAQSNIEITSSCEDINFSECTAAPIVLTVTATTDCAAGSFLTYNYSVDENNDGSFNLSGSSNEVSGIFPVGEHLIIFTITDQCNSSVTCEYLFSLDTPLDNIAPIPVCINGLATVLMDPSGSTTILVSDLESGSSFDNCSNYEDLQFSFSNNLSDTSFTINCNDFCTLNNGFVDLELWVTDEAGNQDFCTVFLIIQDASNVCDCIPIPSPNLITIKNIEGCEFEMDYETCINNGSNCFSNNNFFGFSLENGDSIFLRKNDNPLNGVTTFDLVLIMKHILGELPLDPSLRELAADVDESGVVTSLDLVLIRALILQINTQFPSGKSWVFSPEGVVFDSTILNYEFIALKLGDVNDSAAPLPGSCLQGGGLPSETRTLDKPLQLYTDNQFLQKGETYTIPIFAENYKDLLGGQFTMNFAKEKIRIEEVVSGDLEAMSEESFGLSRLNEGILLGSWANGSTENLDVESPVFELKITALENTSIKEVLEINSTILNAEVYREIENEIDLLDIQFDVLEKVSREIEAIPNPFTGFTNISFTNEQEGLVELNVYDVSGKLIFTKKENKGNGQQYFNIERNDLPANGIYFYKIKTDHQTMSGKLIMQ